MSAQSQKGCSSCLSLISSQHIFPSAAADSSPVTLVWPFLCLLLYILFPYVFLVSPCMCPNHFRCFLISRFLSIWFFFQFMVCSHYIFPSVAAAAGLALCLIPYTLFSCTTLINPSSSMLGVCPSPFNRLSWTFVCVDFIFSSFLGSHILFISFFLPSRLKILLLLH